MRLALRLTVLASLLVPTQSFAQAERAAPDPRVAAIEDVRMLVVGADDLATAASLVTIANGLKTLFGGATDDKYRSIIDQLDRIEEQNKRIIDLLTRAVDLLENLDIVVAKEVREGFLTDLRADIRSAIELWRETASALASDSGYRRVAEENFRKSYSEIRRLSRKIAGYGPGVFHTYGVLMAHEYETGRFLRQPRSERRAAFEQYDRQFQLFIDPTREDSVAAALDRAKRLRDQINVILDEADKTLALNRVFVVSRGHEFSKMRRGASKVNCHVEYKKDILGQVNGDRKTSYSLQEYWGPEYDERVINCDEPEGPCKRCVPLAILETGLRVEVLPASLPRVPGWGNVRGQVAALEALRVAAPGAEDDLKAAQRTMDAAKEYAEMAKTWLSSLR